MRKALNFSNSKSDLDIIGEILYKEIAYCTDDDWEIISLSKIKEYADAYSEDPDNIDISYFDITNGESKEVIENLRNENKKSMLIIISDDKISPLVYMTPKIMPSSLLLKPLNGEEVSKRTKELLSVYYKKDSGDSKKKFRINAKSGKTLVPLDKVLYFEAREKKVFLNTRGNEIGFHSTLDIISKELPQDFIRCHRGFIVNINKVTKIDSSENLVYLGEDIVIPFSRGYKKTLTEAMERAFYG